MQSLYTLSNLENQVKPGEPQKILLKHFDQSRSLLVYLIWFLKEVCQYAEKDAHQRASKHLPSADDLNVNTKLAGNELVWKITEDANLTEQLAMDKPQLKTDKDLIKKIYTTLTDTPQYKSYINKSGREKQDEKAILEFILNDLMLDNEIFLSHIEDLYNNLDDDGDMIGQLLAGYLSKPGSINFNQLLSLDKLDFGKSLLKTVIEKEEHLQQLIVPKLKNWDPERIAQLDMVMMKMGVAEFLYFDTIPPKVTINEYIDIAKEYSTQQSGQFVNGILDNIHKDLVEQGKMQKVDFRKGA
ncbi:MAG: transcription antitermination factor NusB [Bacteroidota bacterium]|jgi:N utilization substance protein B